MGRFYVRDKISGKLGVVDTKDYTCEYVTEMELNGILTTLGSEFCEKCEASGNGILRKIYKDVIGRSFEPEFFKSYSIPDLDSGLSFNTLLGNVIKTFDYNELLGVVILVVRLNTNDLLILKTNGVNFEYFAVSNCNIASEYPCMAGSAFNRIVLKSNSLDPDSVFIRLVKNGDQLFFNIHTMSIV